MEHEHTPDPDRVFAALSDVGNLPRYVPQVTAAERGEGESVTIEARYEGHTQRGEGWFRSDNAARKIEWGAEHGGYHGWLQVSPESEGSRLTLFLATARGNAPDGEVMGTLDAIRRPVEADN
jgi:hypothetical protein